jgi:hypothetical protein
MNESTCEGCGADIIWIKDQKGTRVPLTKRRVRAYMVDGAAHPFYMENSNGEPVLIHVSHFITCPDADKFSKGGGG